MKKSVSIGIATITGMAGALLIGSSSAHATAPTTMQLTCDGQVLTVRTNSNSSSDNGGWSVAQVVGGGSGHLVPVVFHFSAYDNTTDQPIFDGQQVKGAGNANHNQSTVDCIQQQTGTLADLLSPGDQPPPGTSLTDDVTTTVDATAVWQH